MNEYHSLDEWKYIPRWINAHLETALRDHPVVVITGPRQVGKSTLLHYAPATGEWPFLSLDDLDVLEEAQKNPSALLAGKDRLILDEIQKAPQLLSEVKRMVDRSGRRVRIVLSGSANLLLMEQVSETLAGRAVFLSLDAMAYRESLSEVPSAILDGLLHGTWPEEGGFQAPLLPLPELILRGMAPPLLYLPEASSIIRWWEGYVSTFLERDLRSLSRIDSLPNFRRLMSALALRSGQMINQTEISRDIGMPQPTLHRHLNLLEVMCLLYRLPAFTLNRTKRLIKTLKMFWFDAALSVFLAGYHDPDSLANAREWGGFLETLIFQQLRVWSSLQVPRSKLSFWRTSTGKEVDFVIEKGRQVIAIEVKSDNQARYRDTENLRLFLQEYPDLAVAGILAYTGSQIKRMDEKIIAVPWQALV